MPVDRRVVDLTLVGEGIEQRAPRDVDQRDPVRSAVLRVGGDAEVSRPVPGRRRARCRAVLDAVAVDEHDATPVSAAAALPTFVSSTKPSLSVPTWS